MFVLDTGTPVTVVRTDVAEKLDLTANRAIGISRLVGPLGVEEGYVVSAAILNVMGRKLSDFPIHCHDLDPRLRVQGILGLDILRLGEPRLNVPRGHVELRWP